jgi:hypothetical protein
MTHGLRLWSRTCFLLCMILVGVLCIEDELYTINPQKLKSYAVSNDIQPIRESSSQFHKTVTMGLDSVAISKPLSLNDWMSHKAQVGTIKDERDFIPEWVGSAKQNTTVSWTGPCFRVSKNTRY